MHCVARVVISMVEHDRPRCRGSAPRIPIHDIARAAVARKPSRCVSTTARPAGVDTVTLAGHVDAGERGFAASCARCHGAVGEGTVIAPAVFGADSYSIGAGLARQKMLATFVRHSMPFDQPGTLSAQEAADIAAYVLTQPRQDLPGKEGDWPNGNPPRDAAYATDAARAAGKPLPPARPVLPRRVAPGM